jgi:hypothetical protein
VFDEELHEVNAHLQEVLRRLEGLPGPLAVGVLAAAASAVVRQELGMVSIPVSWTREPGAHLALRAFEYGDDQVAHLLTQVSNRYLLRYLTQPHRKGQA